MREKALKLQRPKTVQILRAKTVNPLIRVFSAIFLRYKIRYVIYNISHVGAGIPVGIYVFLSHEYQEMRSVNSANLPAFFNVLSVQIVLNLKLQKL